MSRHSGKASSGARASTWATNLAHAAVALRVSVTACSFAWSAEALSLALGQTIPPRGDCLGVFVKLDGNAPRRCRHPLEAVLSDPQVELAAVVSAPRCISACDLQRVSLAHSQGRTDGFPALEGFRLVDCRPRVAALGDDAVLGKPGSNLFALGLLIDGRPLLQELQFGHRDRDRRPVVNEQVCAEAAEHGLGRALLHRRGWWRGPRQHDFVAFHLHGETGSGLAELRNRVEGLFSSGGKSRLREGARHWQAPSRCSRAPRALPATRCPSLFREPPHDCLVAR